MINDQTARERALDISKSFLVQAPAGSGKTSLLVQRFLCALATATQGPEEIIAITFTRKAAAEMRDRILNALELGMGAEPTDSYNQKLWQLARQVLHRDAKLGWNILQNPARLKIQTIDALCASITKQMPILSRFGSQPQIEPDATLLYNRAVDQLLQTLDQNLPWHDALMLLLGYLDNDRTKIKRLLFRMLEIREQWLPILMRHCAMTDMRNELEAGLSLAVAETLEQLEFRIPEILDFSLLPCSDPQDLTDWMQIAAVLLTGENQWRKAITAKEGFAPPSKAKDKDEKAMLQARKDAMLAMLEALHEYDAFKQQLIAVKHLPPQIYTDQQWAIVDALTIVLPVLAAQLTVVFKDHGKVDFIEVALAAISALQNDQAPNDLALTLDCKIKHILVDEFQDTSHTQYHLLECLTANWDPDDGRTLFLVGDPMQSIYRFRQAEVGLYLKAKQRGINNVKLNFLQLSVNFRSSAAVMNWINRVFTASFPAADDMTLGAISYMPAQPAAAEKQNETAVQCYAVDSITEPLKIVELIKQHKQQNPEQSIAILVRAKSHLLNILPALRQHNIEYQGVEIENLRERPLIQDLLALTKALLHLDDRIAWLAILRAPWCGLTLADLHLLTNDNATIWQCLQQTTINERAERLKAVMIDALAQLGRIPLAELVHDTWVNLGGMHCLQESEALQEAEAYFQLLTSFGNQRELYTADFLSQQLERLFLPAANVNHQAVQVMTMHKAKGLEFDVVILPGLAKSIKGDDQQLLLLEQRDFAQQYLLIAAIRAASQQFDPIYEYLAWCEKQRQEHETLRLFYVAATRAKSQIYCLAAVGDQAPQESSMLSKIDLIAENSFACATGDAMVGGPPVARSDSEHEWGRPSGRTRSPNAFNSQRVLMRLPAHWYTKNPYHPKTLAATKITISPWQADWLRVAGIVMHRTLHNIAKEGIHTWDLQRLTTQQLVWRQHLRQLGLAHKYHEPALEIIHKAIANTMHDQFGAKILASHHQESYSEWRLSRATEDQFEHMVLDRVFVDADNILWLIDYKLVQNEADLEKATHTYAPQLHKYLKILREQKPGYKIIAGLYFPLQTVWRQL